MILNKLRNLMASRGTAAGRDPQSSPEDGLPAELAPLAAMLSVRFGPRTEFVFALEQRLMQAPVARPWRVFPAPALPRPAWLVRIAAMTALLAGVIVALLFLSGRDPQPEVANAMVLADSAEKLLGLHTVRYETRAEISHGVCYTGYNAPLTDEEKAALAARGETPSVTGIVYGCFAGPQVMSETGVYDLDRRAFSATMRLVEGETGIRSVVDGPGPYDPRDRVFVDDELYVRDSGGEWRLQPTQNRWMPFSLEGFGAVPAGDLSALSGQYDEVIKLGEERLEGVRVAHFRATRTTYQGPETVEAWIGVDDGLPRRAVITVETENSQEWHLKRITDSIASVPEAAKYKNDPIVLRGDWPAKKTITWKYAFSNFNEPVEIEAPTQ